MTTLDELLGAHGRLTTVHVERWVERGLLRPTAEGDAWAFRCMYEAVLVDVALSFHIHRGDQRFVVGGV